MAQHCEPEILALRALGEAAGSGADDDHLRTCARCQAELDQLQAVAATSRTVTPADALQPPPTAVWDRVVDELGLPAGPESAAASEPVHAPADVRKRDVPAETVTPIRRGPPRWAVSVAAAVAGVAIGVAGTLLIRGSSDEATQPAPVVARATLDPVPAGTVSAAGSATVDEQAAGPVLNVTVADLPGQDGFYEVWLLDSEAQRMLPLGILDADHQGSFALPPGLDLSEFPVVDVSLEPYDGDPTHSSDSVSRGVLTV
jgi:anti-sigma-K factor RskA